MRFGTAQNYCMYKTHFLLHLMQVVFGDMKSGQMLKL